MRLPASQFVRFCLVGTLGFVVDAGLLHWLIQREIAGLYSGRVVSFLVAASATWALNRRFTFRRPGTNASGVHGARAGHRQWSEYVAFTAGGAAINYGVYVVCLAQWPWTRNVPAVAVAAGAAVALAFNYLTAKYIVFRPR